VRVNGRVAGLGDSADPARDRIELDGQLLELGEREFWMLHKPRGVLSTTRDPQGRPTVLDYLPAEVRARRLYPVGRLDLDTEGLVLLTNDGEVAEALLHPSRGSEREYRVTVRGRLPAAAARSLREGVELDDGRSAPAQVGPTRYDAGTDTTTFALTMIEGRKRQIRRMLRAQGHPVRGLVRTRMGPLELGDLAPGEARPLDPKERATLLDHARRHGARLPEAEAETEEGPR
jgi:23S rRNA pseudouridine2605 synthase